MHMHLSACCRRVRTDAFEHQAQDMLWCEHRTEDLKDKAQALFIESTGIGIAFHSREGLLCVQQQHVLLLQLLQRCNFLLS